MDKHFNEMSNKILEILKATYNEKKDNHMRLLSQDEMLICNNAILQYDNRVKKLFRKIPKAISTSTYPHNDKDNVDYFDKRAIVVEDGIHAAGGRFNYVYRAKGERVLWFENGSIIQYSIYCAIDKNGFQFWYTDMGTNEISTMSKQYFQTEYCTEYTFEHKFRNPYYIFKYLLNINESYLFDYYLEYVFDPPDVDLLSEFSKDTRSCIWNLILNIGYEAYANSNNDDINFFKFCVSFLNEIEVPVEVDNILEILNVIHSSNQTNQIETLNEVLRIVKQSKENQEKIINSIDKNQEIILNSIEENVIKTNELFELKPNFMGFAINLNELLRIIKDKIRKLKDK